MAKKLEDILKARGFTDADLDGMKTMLENPKFRGALEDEYGAVETERDGFKTEAERWANWHRDEALPKLQGSLDREQEARAEAAGYRERLQTLQEQGLIKLAEQKEPEKKEPLTSEFDPKKYNLVTQDDVLRFADMEGDAIALAQDISAEHYALFGSPLTNFRKLRTEAKAAKVPVDKYWEQSYKVPEKRTEIETKRRADAEAVIRADERSKTVAEFANPHARPGVSSRQPFIPRPKDASQKQPWEMDLHARRGERVAAVTAKLLQ